MLKKSAPLPAWTASTWARPTSRLLWAGHSPGDPAVELELDAALETISEAAASAGIAAGIHTPAETVVRQRLTRGCAFTTVASDLTHLEQVAKSHLDAATAKNP